MSAGSNGLLGAALRARGVIKSTVGVCRFIGKFGRKLALTEFSKNSAGTLFIQPGCDALGSGRRIEVIPGVWVFSTFKFTYSAGGGTLGWACGQVGIFCGFSGTDGGARGLDSGNKFPAIGGGLLGGGQVRKLLERLKL